MNSGRNLFGKTGNTVETALWLIVQGIPKTKKTAPNQTKENGLIRETVARDNPANPRVAAKTLPFLSVTQPPKGWPNIPLKTTRLKSRLTRVWVYCKEEKYTPNQLYIP